MDPALVREHLARGDLNVVLHDLVALWSELRSPRLASTIEGLTKILRIDSPVDRARSVTMREPSPGEAAAIQLVVEWLREARKQPAWKAARDGMWSAIVASPGDFALRQIIGDQLLERGDPFGELVALTSSTIRDPVARARERELVATLGPGVYGPIIRAVDPTSLALVSGFFDSCTLYEWPRDRKALPLVTLRELKVMWTRNPVSRLATVCPLLTSLHIGESSLGTVLRAGHPRLERLAVQITATSPIGATTLGPFPSLRAVQIDVPRYYWDLPRFIGWLLPVVEVLPPIVELSTVAPLDDVATWWPIATHANVRRFSSVEPVGEVRWQLTIARDEVTAQLLDAPKAGWWQTRRLKQRLPPELRERVRVISV